MAYYSISKSVGQTEFDIAESTDQPSAGDIELSIDLTKLEGGYSNKDVLIALEEFMNFLSGKSAKVF